MSYIAVPLVDQLTDSTVDGRPSENAGYDCVEASTVAVQKYWTGTRLSTDQLKDLAYGEAWRDAGTSEDRLIGIMASHGVQVTRFNGSQAALWAKAQAEAAAGRPPIISTPSAWDSQPSRMPYTPWAPNFPTHAQVFCGVQNGIGRLMNPWHGVYMDRAISWFQQRLCWGCIYLTNKSGGSMATYTKLPDGRFQFAAGLIGVGFAELYVSQGETGDLSIPETYYNPSESFARFTSGTVFHYDAHSGKATVDTTGIVVDGLYSAWRAAVNTPAPAPVIKEVVPADLSSALKTLAHYAQ